MSVRFPRGVRGAVEKYADRIEQAVKLDVDWDNPLGCGSFGCVFPTSEQGKVLKISSDPTEGPVVKAVMDTKLDKRSEGLGRWYGVWRIPEAINAAGPRSTGWVILREDVKPFDAMKDLGFATPRWLMALREYNAHARKSIDLKTEYRREHEWEGAQEKIGTLFNYEETYYVAEAIEELNRSGIRLADVHHGNLGFRIFPTEDQPTTEVRWFDNKNRPPLLIFDLGHSSAPPGMTIDDLWNEVVQANPGVVEYASKIRSI